jgi:hypothetical protein
MEKRLLLGGNALASASSVLYSGYGFLDPLCGDAQRFCRTEPGAWHDSVKDKPKPEGEAVVTRGPVSMGVSLAMGDSAPAGWLISAVFPSHPHRFGPVLSFFRPGARFFGKSKFSQTGRPILT